MATTLIPEPVAPAPEPGPAHRASDLIVEFASARRSDVPTLGGKGANLGELTAAGLPVPPGFVLSIDAYRQFYESNELGPKVGAELEGLDPDNPAELDRHAGALRQMILSGIVPDSLRTAIESAYDNLLKGQTRPVRVAVRSSATAEDTAQFSFAGMFESFLNISGKSALIEGVKACWASTFGARVLFYRIKQGLPIEMPVAVIVQRMVNADKSGVIFTSDPATRDPSHLVIEAAWGLGESVVQGAVTPDRHVLDKQSLAPIVTEIAQKEFLLTWDDVLKSNVRIDLLGDPRAKAAVLSGGEIQILGTLARRAEEHYGVPQDLEFAIEGANVYLTQSRPITTLGARRESVTPGASAKPFVHGLGASPGRATGAVRVLDSPTDEASMKSGEILVTRMTSPDWVPIMRRAAAIVTDAGGMTSHAAIVARELGLPCIVGAHDATRRLVTGMLVTVDGGAGTVDLGAAAQPETAPVPARTTVSKEASTAGVAPITATRLYVNLAEPDRVAEVAARDVDGVGLLRAEFMMLEALDHM
ncbi:MAG TPA: PEP/pyruvate-binding domain-containing protein, partial [Gemmatimonadaceae bacterium]